MWALFDQTVYQRALLLKSYLHMTIYGPQQYLMRGQTLSQKMLNNSREHFRDSESFEQLPLLYSGSATVSCNQMTILFTGGLIFTPDVISYAELNISNR